MESLMSTTSKFPFLLILLLCFAQTLLAEHGWHALGADDHILSEYRIEGDKIYIQPNQLNITNEGIFVIVQGEQVLVPQLNCDENGTYCLMEYLDKITDKCYNGHKIWCKRCLGCVVRYCKFRCKCVEWESI